ncbi:hypothetical protein PHYSODRAFT_503691 [Phytophthora sojae]|uniref:Centrosomal protein of 19 kDa n=1 Tax=Phytophthora sojae (strain P6497) TaxID=1094619 RepID=G4ZI22_PHYSP|nr:hypothetical protein PHYSODRAFT_503691 [Phytophthora sojae]EGZ17665.1 hypothetical protein PHYSODRAFT_503691 [Phytophthora sojae]|eukprot:XP_009526723.1 hypothetical protein PHYSODRAFT_503691 [Phytophthora sojae]
MIVPTRFGLKYAPIPTLALEYEDDLKGVVDATGQSSSSLYVYRDGDSAPVPTRKLKLHVVELPMLTRTSETQQITRQLQQDNGRFLAPGIVSETQLKRLLDRLVENLPPDQPTSFEAESDAEAEREEDAKRTRALRSESDVSEEDVQSEELEYFSEDGSDEDSF